MASLKYKDPADGQWKYLLVPVAGAEVHVGPDAPTGPEELWYDTDALPTSAVPTVFASKAALLAGWPSPPVGAQAWVSDIKILASFNGVEWQRVSPYKKWGRSIPTGTPGVTSANGMTAWPPAANGGQLGVTINKFAVGSLLEVTFITSGYATVSIGKVDWYIRCTGAADALGNIQFFNATGDHRGYTATLEIANNTAGTIGVSLFIWAGAGITFNCDGSDYYSMTVEEVNPT